MDLHYLREHPEQLATFLKHQRIRETPVPGGSICRASRLTFDTGESLFTKSWPEEGGQPPAGFFAAEAAGLRWLGEAAGAAGGVAVPEVLVELPDLLGMEWVEPGEATPEAAQRLGRELARTHRAGAEAFGAGWAGFHGSVPMDNTLDERPWHVWYVERRLKPYLALSVARGALADPDLRLAERAIAAIDGSGDEPPSRIHGDLWTGNLLWGADGRCHLVDPAAHGGHRETDLAYLGLWGEAPYLSRILAGYQDEWPLLPGWQARVPWHQLSMYLLHTALFGERFAAGVRDAASRVVGATR